MGILERARRDWGKLSQRFSTDLITLTAPTGETVSVKGIQTRHNIGIDTDGQLVQSANAHVTIAESLLVDYPVRNTANVVAMYGHKVTFNDNRGVLRYYSVTEIFPDESVGMITLILGDFSNETDFENDFSTDFQS